jgi:hypothetical protein
MSDENFENDEHESEPFKQKERYRVKVDEPIKRTFLCKIGKHSKNFINF